MNLDTYARGQVARFCIEEGARYGGTSHMIALTCVLRNRLFAGWGTSWLDILNSAEEKRGCDRISMPVDLRSANVRQYLQRFDDLYTGRDEEDYSGGGLWYTDTTQPQREWFKEQILGNIGEHPLVGQCQPLMMFG